jgi:hypothetical protein
MGIGTGRVVRQFGGRGMFSIVKVEATPAKSGLTVTVDQAATNAQGASEYLPAVTTVIRYAWEKLGRYQRGDGAVVKVLEITPLLVDTTEITMVYAAALATWDALQLDPEHPIVLDPESRRVNFRV